MFHTTRSGGTRPIRNVMPIDRRRKNEDGPASLVLPGVLPY